MSADHPVVTVHRARSLPRPGALRLLDDTELTRLTRLRRPDDRDRYLTTHALARVAVAGVLGCRPEEVAFTRTCRTCGQEHGKPRVVPCPGRGPLPRVSLSHAGEIALVAVTTAGEVGVDVETVAAAGFEGFAEVALHPLERRALAELPPSGRAGAGAVWWTRKEALLKATGAGLAVDPRQLVVTGPGEEPRLLRWEAPEPAPGAVRLTDLDVGGAAAAAVAVLTEAPLRLDQVDGDAALAGLA